jgi:peptidoglycan/LPS O-acetylase OafA/YrhL
MYRPRKILSIEAIRGFAAIYVMLGHIVQLYRVYDYFPKLEFMIKTLFGFGHEAVILFFMVSGFSIHYSSSLVDYTKKNELKQYFYKRLKRIYPLFLLCLIFSLVVLFLTDETSNIKRNILSFLFLTDVTYGALVNPIATNLPIWSLTYEVFYYILYPVLLIGMNKFGLKNVFILTVLISFMASLFGFLGYPNHIANMFKYYCIWTVGTLIADFKLNHKTISIPYLKGLLIVSVAFMLTFEKISILGDWFCALFFMTIFISFFMPIDKDSSFFEKMLNLILSFGAIITCYNLTFYDAILFHPSIVRYLLLFLGFISVLLFFIPIASFQSVIRMCLKPFVSSGSFSYAFYIFHWPLIILVNYFFVAKNQLNIFFFFTIILLNIIIVFVVSRYLEIRVQPKISKWLDTVFIKTVKERQII